MLDARNPALERAIVDDPNDLDSYMVYADWLIEQGDPRGELITAQIAAERGDANQRRAAIGVFAKHRDYFLGNLGETIRADAFDWKSGFIHHARLAHDYAVVSGGAAVATPIATIAGDLFAHPSARFLVKLTVGDGDPGPVLRPASYYSPRVEPRDIQGVLDRIGGVSASASATAAPTTLRELVLGRNPHEEQPYIAKVGRLDAMCPGLPNLTDLEVGGKFTLDAIALPNVRRATFRPFQLSSTALRALARGTWPRLQSLTIQWGQANQEGRKPAGFADIQFLLRRVDLSLDHLALIGCPFSNPLLAALAHAPLVKRLTELDISDGSLTDKGVRAIAREHEAFRHLELFDATGNKQLSATGVTMLRRLAPDVIV